METTDASIRLGQAAAAGGQLPPQALAPRLRAVAAALRAKPFRPHPLLRSGHAQTIGAHKWPRRRALVREVLPEAEERLFEVEPGVRMLAHCLWQSARRERPTAVLVHGLEGSSASPYLLGTGRKAFGAGFNVLLVNMRNCGGTDHLTPTLYHSGMSGDILSIIRELVALDRLPSVYVGGFSMGGQLVLKLAGDCGDSAPAELGGVCAVSPSLDLGSCAAAIERPANWLYERAFVRALRRRMVSKQKLYPDIYDTTELRRVRSVRDFDNLYTAAHGGFRDADDYYARMSALPLVPRISVPTLIIHAQDDPLIPFGPFRSLGIADNPDVILLAPRHGGHVGFVAAGAGGGEDRFWAENRTVEFFRLLARPEGGD